MTTTTAPALSRERLTFLLVLEIFLLFFQGFMIAPLVPRLAVIFGTDVAHASHLVPAYTLPYGIVCLLVGPLADRYGRAKLQSFIVSIAVVIPLLTTTATTFHALFAWRIVCGLALGGLPPIALAMIAQMFPYAERGRPVGWLFGAIAGGMALGATFGPWLEPVIGWRGLFVLVAALNLMVAIPTVLTLRAFPKPAATSFPLGPKALANAYGSLLKTRRGGTLYGYVFLNGVFHAGIFSWLGVYFTQRFNLSSSQLGFAMLGYGIPGFLLGPFVGKLADRIGRRPLIRIGLFLASACAFTLMAPLPALAATATITALSFGFDLTHPLFSGMISALDPVRTAQAMALNTFMVFVGYGSGSLLFGALYGALGMPASLCIFGAGQLVLALASLALFDESWR